MAKYIQGIAPGIGPVGSFSYESGCTHSDLSSSFFSDSRGSPKHFLAQIPPQISRSKICIARFVAVPRELQKQGWGRKLFRGLYNSLIHEGATLALLEVDPFIAWPESDELYAREISWRTAFYESEGWTPLKNQTTDDEVLRIFMYSNPIASSLRDTGELVFCEIDELIHRRHQAESDNEYSNDLDLNHNQDRQAEPKIQKHMKNDQTYATHAASSNETPETNKMNWWRWPLVPIGSIAGAVGGAILVSALQWIAMKFEGRISEDGWWVRFVEPLMVSGVFGYLWSTLAYSIAPKGKLIAAVVMTTLLGVLWGTTIVIVLNDSNFPVFNKVYASISVVTSMIAAICGVVSKHSE